MPYLHFETDESRQQMKKAANEAFARCDKKKACVDSTLTPKEKQFYNRLLSSSPLHLRRPLDRAYYSAIDSERRDKNHGTNRHRRHHLDAEEPEPPSDMLRDEKLIHAYLLDASPLHPRRTLDQYYYAAGDTEERDQDQVVYRYCKKKEIEPRVFMVDQLWLWILGKGDLPFSFFLFDLEFSNF
jgi:hypothetical protein